MGGGAGARLAQHCGDGGNKDCNGDSAEGTWGRTYQHRPMEALLLLALFNFFCQEVVLYDMHDPDYNTYV